MAYNWDPLKVHSNFALSNGDRTITCSTSGTNHAAISDWSKSSGKWYWELKIDNRTGSFLSLGICYQGGGTDFDLSSRTGWNESWAVFDYNASALRKYHDGAYSNLTSTGSFATDSVLMFAIDIDTNMFWAGMDGIWFDSGDPANGTNPIYDDSTITGAISACASLRYVNDAVTSCFKASELAYTPPSGFSAIDTTSPATEPDIADQGIGFDETIGVNVELGRGVSGTIGFSVEAGAAFAGQGAVDAGIGFDETLGRSINVSRGIEAGIGFGATAGASLERDLGIDSNLGFRAECGAVNYSAWLRENRNLAKYRYHATITGGADGLDDYPMVGLKSFQCRMKSGTPSYLSLVLVFNSALLDAISERSQGDLVLYVAAVVNGSESLREELIRAPFGSVRYDQGAQSRSITLTGYATRDYGGTRVALENVTVETLLSDGRMQFRCARPDFYLRPGDTAIYGPHEITVGSISCSVGANTQSMDVSE